MKTIEMLTRRNIKFYYRDRATVFFSLLTIIIIIVLNVLFLGKLNIDAITENYPDLENEATFFVNTWVLAGIIYTSTLTVPLSAIGVMIDDEEQKRMKAFYTSPVKRIQLALGYIISAFLLGMIMSIITLGISQFYIFLTGNELLSFSVIVKLLVMISVNVFFNSSLVFLMSCLVRTSSSFTALNIIFGTLIGFVAGIYLPVGMLPKTVGNVLAYTPFLHGASLLRRYYTDTSLSLIFHGAPHELISEYKRYMGITLSHGDSDFGLLFQFSFLLICAILCIIASALILKKKRGSDR